MIESTIYFAYPGDLKTQTGGYSYDRRLIDELRGLGLEVEALSLPLRSLNPDQQTLNGVQQIFAALPDQAVVIIDGLAFGVLDDLAMKEHQRLRLIGLCHHPLALETGLNDAQKKTLLASEKKALSFARATIVTSDHTKQVLIDQFGLPAEKVIAALPGTDLVPFALCDGNPIRLLTVASLTQRKGHDVLIDSLATLKPLCWQARFVGGIHFDPDWAKKLREQVNTLELSERIIFAGSVDDTQAEYQQADVFVLPSRFEGYGMVFAEALAAGLPVIAARAGAVPQVVPEAAGLLVPPDDTQALTDALRQVLTNEPLRRSLQVGAKQAAAALTSWTDTAKLVARKIEEVRMS
jgi:glycosyltransferase involved in cell wall biosynthesis